MEALGAELLKVDGGGCTPGAKIGIIPMVGDGDGESTSRSSALHGSPTST